MTENNTTNAPMIRKNHSLVLIERGQRSPCTPSSAVDNLRGERTDLAGEERGLALWGEVDASDFAGFFAEELLRGVSALEADLERLRVEVFGFGVAGRDLETLRLRLRDRSSFDPRAGLLGLLLPEEEVGES
jgi:hypothetical protein